jgi:hypoxanthine phosphoribosyltransferase
VLLLKEGRQEVEYRPDYVAFHIPDLFVVGYGLDYRDQWRQLPYVATLESSDLADAAP